MVRRILVWTGLLVIAAGAPAFAQARVEISGFAGWVFSDGVSGDATLGLDGNFYDRIDPKDGGNFGFMSACSRPTTQRSASYMHASFRLSLPAEPTIVRSVTWM